MPVMMPTILFHSTLVRRMTTGTDRILARNYLEHCHLGTQTQCLSPAPPNQNGYLIRRQQQQYRSTSFCSPSSTRSTTGSGMDVNSVSAGGLLSRDDDDSYAKLLAADNRERFLKCIQNKRLKSQDEQATRKSSQHAKLASVLIAICTDEDG